MKRGTRNSATTTVKYDRRLEEILRQATAVFYEKGYHRASIRDVARRAGTSLAGLYYYTTSKENLLYLIQKHAFDTILNFLREELDTDDPPEIKLKLLILNHLKYFIENMQEMKVLSHEAESLADRYYREVAALKKQYYKICFDLVEALKAQRKLKNVNTRIAVLSLFGMMNWIYYWYRPKVDGPPERVAETMATIFLEGALKEANQKIVRRFRPGNVSRANGARRLAAA